MTQYLDKSAVIAEIEKYISNYKRVLNKVDKSSDDWVDSTLMLESKIDVLQHILSFLDTLEVKEVQEEPVSEDLEEVATKYAQDKYLPVQTWQAFKAGAQWQKEQFEKNCLEHCDSITEEQYNLECGFIDQYLKKYHRTPTFLDAIEYGMKKQREITYESM